jgi:hypothetical protein
VAQVFELAGLVGRRPIGNIRSYRAAATGSDFSRHGEMRTSPEIYGTRQEAERALWRLGSDGRADVSHDRRFYALVLLATFGSLR